MDKRLNALRVRETLIYFPDTGRFVWRERPPVSPEARRWNSRYAGRETFTSVGSKGYLLSKIDAVGVRAHHAAWAFIHGEWPHGLIDHINGDVADNRISNLRVVDPTGNAQNMRAYIKRSGLPPGVNHNHGKFMARIQLRGCSRFLGNFLTAEEAHQAYLRAVEEMGFSDRHGR